MIIATMNDLPDHTVDEVLGELGSTVPEICAYGTAVRVTKR